MRNRILVLPAFLLAASLAAADPGPTLLTVFPPGIKAGETVEVTFTGTKFDGEEQLLFSDPRIKSERLDAPSPPISKEKKKKGNKGGRRKNAQKVESIKFKVTAPSRIRGGVLDVRLVSTSGLTNPRAFAVGTLNEVNEFEPNDVTGQAQKVAIETTINGVISATTDVDYVAVPLKAGTSVVAYCLTTSIDSRMQAELMAIAPDGKPLASNHGYRDGDAVLDFKAPVDGEYLIRVSQFAYVSGGSDHFYRLTITAEPWIDAIQPPLAPSAGKGKWKFAGRNLPGAQAPQSLVSGPSQKPTGTLLTNRVISPPAGMLDACDIFHKAEGNLLLPVQGRMVLDNQSNYSGETAQPVAVPCDIAGRIEKKGARHWYAWDAKKGDVWTLEVFADRIGSPVDAYFVLTDAKGKVIVEQDDSPETLSPNQFYTKSDDPGRYRFKAPADGRYRVMVSTREAAIQFGDRDQYVLRIAKEKPDFRLAVMPVGTHYLDAGTLAKGGNVLFRVFVWRFDGFEGPIKLSAENLPPGVTCPPQEIGPNQTRGMLALSATSGAADWAGHVTIKGTAATENGKLESTARPFSIVWPIPGSNPGQQAPNSPMIARLDRGPGLALAVRGKAPFTLLAIEKGPIKVKRGGKVEVTLKLVRSQGFKGGVQVYSATTGIGPRPQGNRPIPIVGSIAANKNEVKLSLDIANNITPGTHSLVLRGIEGAAPPKGNRQQTVPVSYPSLPIAIEVEGRVVRKRRK